MVSEARWQHGGVSKAAVPIRINTHDDGWRYEFERRAAALSAALGRVARRVDHIGSTAVPGLDSKPTIDIQISVDDLEDLDRYRATIERTGYAFGERSMSEPDHRFFSAPGRTAHIHVCPAGSEWERRHILFRDYLRKHPEAADRYANVKYQLAGRYRTEREQYANAKTDFIDAEMVTAEEWASRTGWSIPSGNR